MLKKIGDFKIMDFNKITKKQFDDAYNKHLPNNWIRFAYKYFSKETEKKNLSLRNNITFLLLTFFLLGFLGTVFSASHAFIGVAVITYSILLAILVLYLLSAVLFNNKRIKKIMKILGVNKFEYNYLVNKFYE
jgi:hypothetical protein